MKLKWAAGCEEREVDINVEKWELPLGETLFRPALSLYWSCVKSINHYVTSFQVTQQTRATKLVSHCPLMVIRNDCNSLPF